MEREVPPWVLSLQRARQSPRMPCWRSIRVKHANRPNAVHTEYTLCLTANKYRGTKIPPMRDSLRDMTGVCFSFAHAPRAAINVCRGPYRPTRPGQTTTHQLRRIYRVLKWSVGTMYQTRWLDTEQGLILQHLSS